jgi:hypothetical protein
MIDCDGETEFLTRVLTRFGAPEQQKQVLALRIAEANNEVLNRAVHRMLRLMVGMLLIYWTGSLVAESLPPVISQLSSRVVGAIFVGAAISFVAFTLYRVRLQRMLRREIQKCRDLLEATLDWRGNLQTALIFEQYGTLGYCTRCRMEITAGQNGEANEVMCSLSGQTINENARLRDRAATLEAD